MKRAEVTLRGVPAVLKEIHVKTEESGLMPSVVHLDVRGVRVTDGLPVSERLRP